MPNANEPRFPTHVAIIVDGNRRWAKQRMLPVSVGHKAGFDRLREITRYAVGDRGVFVLSLYVFSTENFSRDAKEVGYLMDLFANNFRTIADEMNERGCKVLFSGRREGLQQRVLDAMDYMMDLTKDNEKGIVNFCLNYGGRDEIVQAARRFAEAVSQGEKRPEELDEALFFSISIFCKPAGPGADHPPLRGRENQQLSAVAIGLFRACVPGCTLAGLQPQRSGRCHCRIPPAQPPVWRCLTL